jgi:signal transduction histidine kinase
MLLPPHKRAMPSVAPSIIAVSIILFFAHALLAVQNTTQNANSTQIATIDSLQQILAQMQTRSPAHTGGRNEARSEEQPALRYDTTRVSVCNALVKALQGTSSQRALVYADSAIAESAQLANAGLKHVWLVRSLCAKADVLEQMSNYTDALPLYTQALTTAQAAHNDAEQAKVLSRLAVIYAKQDQYTLALEYGHKALAFAERAGDKGRTATIWNTLGVVYKNQGAYNKAKESYTKALNIAKTLADKTIQISALNNIGVINKNQGQDTAALSAFLEALSIAEEVQDKARQGSLLGNIGNIYLKIGELGRALRYFSKGLTIAEQTGDRQVQQIALINIGNVYEEQKKYHTALEYFRRALLIRQHPVNKRTQSLTLGNMARVLAKLNLPDSALSVSTQALALANEVHATKETALALAAVGEAWLQKRNYQQALAFSEHAVRVADSAGLQEQGLLHRPLRVAADAASALGQHRRAADVLRRLLTLNDSLFTAENAKKIAYLQTQYEVEKRERQISLLHKEKDLQARELRWQRQWQTILLVGISSLVGCAIVLLYLYNLKLRSEVLLQKKNAELSAAHERISHQHHILEVQTLEMHKANGELHQTNARLQALDKEKDEFLGIAAHDLKNPLANILSQAEIIHLYRHRMTEEQVSEGLKRIMHTSERMRGIITQFLEVNAIESGALQLKLAPVDVHAMLQELVQSCQPRAEAKQLSIHLDLGTLSSAKASAKASALASPLAIGALPSYHAFADTVATRSVLDNLLSNAIKFSPYGKNVWIRLGTSNLGANKPSIRIEIQDEGQGIAIEEMTRLFGKFARLSARPTGGEQSTGLGLSIVKKLAEAMNGKVWCESTPGAGATFIVELPALMDATSAVALSLDESLQLS